MNYSQERPATVGMLGETKPPSYLVDYGIQNEKSDLRAHVCVLARTVYVYPTISGVKAIESGRYRARPAKQPGCDYITAWGYLVPPDEIEGCVPVSAKNIIMGAMFRQDDSTSVKGEKAVACVAQLLRIGWFPLPVDPRIVGETDLQIHGLDIVVQAKFRIQVKCDYQGGKGMICTGNLYLQTAESNPFKRI